MSMPVYECDVVGDASGIRETANAKTQNHNDNVRILRPNLVPIDAGLSGYVLLCDVFGVVNLYDTRASVYK
jgi:hypothetical protein